MYYDLVTFCSTYDKHSTELVQCVAVNQEIFKTLLWVNDLFNCVLTDMIRI